MGRTSLPIQSQERRLPATGPAREALRQKGQFWTPDWVAQAMVEYALKDNASHIYDPAVGAGAFFRAAKVIAAQRGNDIELLGAEIDAGALDEARQTGLSHDDLVAVEMRNFVLHPPARRFAAIVANPPYIRHHRLPITLKADLKAFGRRLTGSPLDGRAGLHVYFLLRALDVLEERGRLAFILPADTCEGKFAPALWRWITQGFRLDAAVTFAPEASPFPTVDTNALIFLIQNAPPRPVFSWARCLKAQTPRLLEWVQSGFKSGAGDPLVAQRRTLNEALVTGLSRPPICQDTDEFGATLATFARVMRGIATGDNNFFFLTKGQARQFGIPDEYLRLAIGRTRDVPGDEITDELVEQLDASGRPTRLVALDSRPTRDLPVAVQEYVSRGEEIGLPGRALISQRKPWYKMEVRTPPPFLFAYLGRRHARFIRNTAGVLPLTSFLCVYPRDTTHEAIAKLWKVLQHSDTLAQLARVGKSYGSGAIKVEPRALETLPIPTTVLTEAGITMPTSVTQATLF